MNITNDEAKGVPCPACGMGELRAEVRTESFEHVEDNDRITVVAENVPVEVCPACHEVFRSPEAGRIRDAALCRALGLLTPAEIRALRQRLGLSVSELAARTEIDDRTLSELEQGRVIQDRLIDRTLRMLAADPERFDELALAAQFYERIGVIPGSNGT